ncbi:MAG: DsbA family protein [bacterium]
MEEENKTEEKVQQATIAEIETEEKKSQAEGVKKACCSGGCKKKCKNMWTIAGGVLLVLILAGSYGYKMYTQKVDIGQAGVKVKLEKFLSENVPATAKTEIKDITKDGDLYKITVVVDKNEIPVFVTRDGKKLMQAQGVVELDKAPADGAGAKQAQAPEKTEAENKTDVPTVDLFVMSYCPYGLQMERGVLPAVEALGKKIKFNLKFVDYTLHGPKEVTENVNQYCIEKTQPTKLGAYLKCFWKDSKGASTDCMKTTGVNAAQVATCVSATNKEFNPTEKALGLNKDEAVKFGVQGSPTLVVNGTTLASGRDSASVLKAICSGFTTAPKECQAALSATSPAAGFDDQAAAAAGGSAPAASCATPPTK